MTFLRLFLRHAARRNAKRGRGRGRALLLPFIHLFVVFFISVVLVGKARLVLVVLFCSPIPACTGLVDHARALPVRSGRPMRITTD